jgi:hypothetical protein
MHKKIKHLGLVLLLAGCSEKQQIVIPPALPTASFKDVPTISYEGRTPVGEKVDPATISPNNVGYRLDMDGDGIIDFAIMSGNTLYYAKGSSKANKDLIPVLVIKGTLIAYYVMPEADSKGVLRPKLLFWNDKRDGFFQRCLGVDAHGLPYFGEVEDQ